MRKFLSVVIPRFQETEREIFPLLSSISNQVGIDLDDIEVLITTDGGGGATLDKDFLGLFGFDVKQLRLEENRGCGVARQAAIDIARGEYILCCDADDVLHNVGVLGALIQEAELNAPDILISDFLEESVAPDGRYHYISHDGFIGCWMHGKLLRRGFLEQNNIRFHPDLKYHEDSYFLCVAMALAERMRHYPITTYVWKCNPNSITRKDGAVYTYQSMPEYVRAMTMAWEHVEPLRPEQMPKKVVQLVNYCYLMLHSAGWIGRKELLAAAETAFAEQIAPWLHYYLDSDPGAVGESYTAELGRMQYAVDETEPVSAWLDRLGLNEEGRNCDV